MTTGTFKFSLRHFWLVLVVMAIFAATGVAQTNEDNSRADKTLSPYFVVKGDPAVDQLPLKDTKVEIAVSGVIADVKVVQIYRNEGSRPINATYVFPASTRAAVYAMRMQIGNQVVVAKIKEREKAKQDFETAKKEGKSASLLEQDRPNVFTMNLANIMPQDQIQIELRYTELLVPTDGTYEVVYPTVVGPRYASQQESPAPKQDGFVKSPYLHQNQKSTSAFHISARISAGLPILDLSCPSHQIAPIFVTSSVAQLSLDEADAFQGNRDFILRYRLAGNQITSGLLLYQGAEENFFLYMAQPPQRVTTEDIPPREYIFVVDVSGSMEGFPLNTSKQLLRDLIGKLRPTDTFNVVLFAGDSTLLSEKSIPANQDSITTAIRLLEQQRGHGATELLPAIKNAMSIPRQPNVSRSIVLVTDGYISGEQGVFDYIRENLDQCNVFAFGIGSSVNRYLIEGVAKTGMGEPFIVTDPAESAAIADKFREYIQTPVLTDIKVQANGFEIYDIQPAHFPDLLAQRPVFLFGKWRGPVGGTFTLTGKTGRGDYLATLDVSSVQPDESNRALRFLWARSRVAELSDYGSGNVSEDSIKEITSLGLKYSLLTQYTSFIAVREEVRNPLGQADDVKQAQPLPLGVSDLAVGQDSETGSEPELVWLVSAFGLLVLIMAIRTRRRTLGIARS
ncbi:MAG TPA: VIT domain-containing protein [Pyrinomonadaceae bacterium]|nr:VIT domain-containing protein [Pyrinomonadaceae bacterium]